MKSLLLKKLSFCLIALFSLSLLPSAANAQTKEEVIHGSYFVAFGRFANSGELSYWLKNVGSRTIPQMVSSHRSYIKSNQYEREQTVRRSYKDAFGWQPSNDELKYWSSQYKTYGELMNNHINNWLNIYADKKEHVIKQSYYKAFGRAATVEEVKYWKGQQTYSYAQLVAMHTTWKQKNQYSSSVTGIKPNLNSNDISTALFSPNAVSGVVAAGGLNLIPAGGYVVAAGGMNAIAPR